MWTRSGVFSILYDVFGKDSHLFSNCSKLDLTNDKVIDWSEIK